MSPRYLPTDMPDVVIPQRKISETILDFGTPVLHDLTQDTPIEIVRASFNIAIIVWNAHVMAMPVWNAPQVLEQLQALLETPAAAPQMIEAYHELSARRRERFANDPRTVGQWDVSIIPNQGLRLRCDAHVPPSLMPLQA